MSLEKKIYDDMVAAMKAGDTFKRDALRLLNSEFKKVKVDTRKELTEADVIQIIKSGVKKRQDAMELFKQGNRQDLIDNTIKELKILEAYLPKQLSEQELEKIVAETISALGITSPKDSGKAMKEIMSKHGAEADGKLVQKILIGKLNP